MFQFTSNIPRGFYSKNRFEMFYFSKVNFLFFFLAFAFSQSIMKVEK